MINDFNLEKYSRDINDPTERSHETRGDCTPSIKSSDISSIYVRADKCNPCIEVGFITIFLPLLSSKTKKKNLMSSLRFVNPRVVQARLCVKVMKMKSKWSEGNSKIFIPSVFTEKKGGKKKIKEIRMTAKARKKEWNWILAECGDSRIDLNSEWSPIPRIVSRTFLPRISFYAYVQHSSRYFRISPPWRDAISAWRDITLQK